MNQNYTCFNWQLMARASALALLCTALPTSRAASLLHRWSFNDATDSVGAANASLVGGAQISGGQLQVPGAGIQGSWVNYASVNITNTLNTNASLSVEAWFTLAQLNNWSKVWMFGQDVPAGEIALSYIDFTPRKGSDTFPKIDFDTTAGTEFNSTGPTALNAGQQYYAATVYDASSDTMSLYIDGARVASASMGGGNVTQLSPNTMRFGTGFFYGDPDFNGSINEIRIYGGAVGGLQLAVNALNGPDTLDTTIALNSLVYHVGSSNVSIGDLQDSYITYNTVSYGALDITNSVDATYSVSPPGIVAVSANGRISALAPGAAVVTATRGSSSSQATINVADVTLALQHRYSFNEADGTTVAVDSVDPSWNGTIINATIASGQVVLPGGTVSSDPASAYVDLPNNIVSNLNSITIEAWVTDNSSTNWARLYDFGNSVGGEDLPGSGAGQSYLMLAPRGDGTQLHAEITQNGGATPPSGTTVWPATPLVVSNEVHVAYTIDALGQVARLYVNGTPVGVSTNETVRPKNLGPTVNDWLGRSQWNDPTFNGAIDEFRIWNRALSRTHLAASVAAGPNFLITNAAISALAVTLQTNTMVGGTTQQATARGNFAQTNALPINSAVTNWVSSNTNVLSVNATGLITAVGPGTATVSATVDGITGTSPTITISVVQPTISQQPLSITRYAGASAQFSVTAAGGQLTYQWKKGGVNINGATTSTLVLTGLSVGDNNTTYSVGITNAAGFVVSSSATLTVLALPAGYPGTVMGDSPASYWRLDEASGATAFDLFGLNNGTYSGNVTLGVPGLLPADSDTAITVAGAGAAGGNVTVPYSATLNPTNVTVELWVRPADLAAEYMVALQDRTTGTRLGYAVQHNNGSSAFDFTFGTGPASFSTISSVNATVVGNVYHIVATHDGTTARIYVNGRQEASLVAPYRPANAGAVNLTISSRNLNNQTQGTLDEVAIYPVALSATQVLNHYLSAVYGTSAAPLLLNDLAANVTNYPTANRKFSISAGGSPPLTYQWLVNGNPVSGATASAFSLPNLSTADNLKTVRVVVANAFGTTNSAVSTLHIITTPLLAHRWTFNVDGTDSIGGITCNLLGGATIAGGSLNLPGGGTRANVGEINGIAPTLNANESITVEGWLTITTLANWSKGWMFGNANGGAEPGLSYIDFTPRAGANGNVPSMSINTVTTGEVNTRGGTNPALWIAGQQYHAACTYDANNDIMSMYLNGVLVDSEFMGGRKISDMNVTEAYIGAPVNFGDPDLVGSVNELRIYPGVLPPYQILGNFKFGPDVVAPAVTLTIVQAGGNNVTVTWPSGTLQAAPLVTGGWTNVPSATSPYTVPAAGGQRYFRVVNP